MKQAFVFVFRCSLTLFVAFGLLLVFTQSIGVVLLSGTLVEHAYQWFSPVAFWSSAIAAITGFLLHYYNYGKD